MIGYEIDKSADGARVRNGLACKFNRFEDPSGLRHHQEHGFLQKHVFCTSNRFGKNRAFS